MPAKNRKPAARVTTGDLVASLTTAKKGKSLKELGIEVAPATVLRAQGLKGSGVRDEDLPVLVEVAGHVTTGGRGRPAKLYRLTADGAAAQKAAKAAKAKAARKAK